MGASNREKNLPHLRKWRRPGRHQQRRKEKPKHLMKVERKT